MNTKQSIAIIVFDRNAITYINSTGVTAQSVFVPESVRDFDVVDKEKLSNQIASFIDANKLVPSTLVFLMADNVLFVKDMLPPKIPEQHATSEKSSQSMPKIPDGILTKEEEEKTIKKYLDTVPFERIAYKTYQLTSGKRIIVTNASLTGVIKDVFKKKGFTLSFSVPASILGNDILSAGVIPQVLAQVMSRYDWLRSQAFDIDEEVIPLVPQQPILVIGGKTDYKRLALMGGIFVILLSIMIVMYINSQKPPVAKPISVLPISNPVIAEPTAIVATSSAQVSLVPVSTQSAVQLAKFEKIQIIASNANLPKAQQVKSLLLQSGFGVVDVQPQQGTIGGVTSIMAVDSTVSQTVRDLLIQSINVALPNVTQQQSGSGKYQITITIQG